MNALHLKASFTAAYFPSYGALFQRVLLPTANSSINGILIPVIDSLHTKMAIAYLSSEEQCKVGRFVNGMGKLDFSPLPVFRDFSTSKNAIFYEMRSNFKNQVTQNKTHVLKKFKNFINKKKNDNSPTSAEQHIAL